MYRLTHNSAELVLSVVCLWPGIVPKVERAFLAAGLSFDLYPILLLLATTSRVQTEFAPRERELNSENQSVGRRVWLGVLWILRKC